MSGEWPLYAKLYGQGWARAIRVAKIGVHHPRVPEVTALIEQAEREHPATTCECEPCVARRAWLAERAPRVGVAPEPKDLPAFRRWDMTKAPNPKAIVSAPVKPKPKPPAFDPGPPDPYLSCADCGKRIQRDRLGRHHLARMSEEGRIYCTDCWPRRPVRRRHAR